MFFLGLNIIILRKHQYAIIADIDRYCHNDRAVPVQRDGREDVRNEEVT